MVGRGGSVQFFEAMEPAKQMLELRRKLREIEQIEKRVAAGEVVCPIVLFLCQVSLAERPHGWMDVCRSLHPQKNL